jgi:hypothetical protein
MGDLLLNQGLNTAQDRSYLGPGELQVATGAYYRPGDTVRLWKILGRTSYGDAYAATSAGQGLALIAFDDGTTDRLVVYNAAGEFHSSVIAAGDPTAGSFSTLTTGFSTGTTVLSWAHFDDVWFLCNSKDRPIVINSDGTVRKMGMLDPDRDPIVTATGGTYTGRVTTATWTGSEWSQPALAYDTDLDTYAYSWMRETDVLDDTHTIVWSAAAASTASDRVLIASWSLKGRPILRYGDAPYPPVPGGSGSGNEFMVQTIFHKSEDGGSTWTTLFEATHSYAQGVQSIQSPVTADSDLVQFKATIKQKLASPTRSAGLQIHDVRVTNEGFQSIFTTTDGLYYAVAEYDETNNLESPLASSGLVTFASQNKAQLALPTQVNAHATHFKIYRTHDGGVPPGDYRAIAYIDITETTWYDTFDQDKDFVGGELAPLLKLQITDSIFTYYPSNTAPEAFKAIVEYQNFLVALSEQHPRQLSYSYPGSPEYWPLLYTIINFPLKEHDQLQSLAVAGDLLIVGAKEAIIVINGLPELEAQSYASASMTVMRGAPGCVGPLAMTEYSLAGEPRVVWVSEQGIYETNGHTVRELSSDLDWAATVSLGNLSDTWIFWDREDQILRVGLDTDDDGTPDREYWLHMADEHQKRNGRPKITGPHHSSVTNVVGGLAPDGRWRVYSLDNDTSGATYHEKDGGTDAGNFYSTVSEISLDVKGSRMYGPELQEWAVDFPTVRHTSWNNTPLTFTWTAGRDEVAETDDVVSTMTLSTQGQTKFVVARSGEWHELRIQHTANAGTAASLGAISHHGFPTTVQGDTRVT